MPNQTARLEFLRNYQSLTAAHGLALEPEAAQLATSDAFALQLAPAQLSATPSTMAEHEAALQLACPQAPVARVIPPAIASRLVSFAVFIVFPRLVFGAPIGPLSASHHQRSTSLQEFPCRNFRRPSCFWLGRPKRVCGRRTLGSLCDRRWLQTDKK